MFFQEDEEDYLDEPIRILDFEENTVFCGSENYLKNITIEDPGYVLNISLEDYEVRLQRSLLKLKELKKPTESSGCVNNNSNLFSKCRTCSVKIVDCLKFPWYYQNKHGSTHTTQYLNTEHNVIVIKEEKDEEEVMIIDLTEKEDVEYNKRYDNKICEENKKKIGKIKADWNEFTNINNTVAGKVKKQTYKTLSKPGLNIQKQSYSKVSNSEVEQTIDLIISTHTRLTDKSIQKLKSNIESCRNSENVSHNIGNKLLLSSKSFIKNRDDLSQNTNNFEKVAKAIKDNITNNCKNSHRKKKNNKNSNKIKSIYTSEQISKTKIKIKKSSLKSKEIVSSINYYKEEEDIESNLNLNFTNTEQYGSLKTLIKKRNSLTNENQQNHCENKQERSQYNSSLYALLASPVLTNKITETKNSTSMPNRNIGPDRIQGCNKQLFSSDRIIPHFHKNTSLKNQDILSKTKSKYPKRPKETIYNYETETLKNAFDFPEAFNIEPVVSQIPDPSKQQRIHDYCIGKNDHQKNNNTKVVISNISAIRSVNKSPVTYNLPVNNEMILKKSTYASPYVIRENVNNIDYMSQSKKIAAQLEKERQRYLLPSNCILPDSHIQNIFSFYGGSNLNTPPYI